MTIITFGAGSPAFASEWKWHYNNNWVDLTIWRTNANGERMPVGAPTPARSGPYTASDTIILQTSETIKDYDTETDDGTGRTAQQDCGFQAGDPGSIEHVDADQALQALGRNSVRFPSIHTPGSGSIYVGVDIATWVVLGGDESFDIFNPVTVLVVNGSSPALPGYVIGSSPLTFSAGSGWINPNPYDGDVELLGEMFAEQNAPIPTVSEWGLIVMTLLLLTAGTVVLGRRRRPAAA